MASYTKEARLYGTSSDQIVRILSIGPASSSAIKERVKGDAESVTKALRSLERRGVIARNGRAETTRWYGGRRNATIIWRLNSPEET